jgi:plastocyanin
MTARSSRARAVTRSHARLDEVAAVTVAREARRHRTRAIVACAALLAVGCRPSRDVASGGVTFRAVAPRYAPHMREIAVTTVPLLVKEDAALYPFLAKDFAKGGVLDGKEVYAFSPSSITVVQGDTIHFTFINPEDDVHSFVLPDFAVSLPAQRTTTATYVARQPGVFPFVCAIQAHLPMMSGQLVVLPAVTMTGGVR